MKFFDLFRQTSPPLIKQALQDMNVMLQTAHDMFVAATAHLLDNAPLDVDLTAKDRVVNQKEQAIRRAVLEHVTINPDQDIVLSLVLVSIVQDAERIGDLAKTLAEVAELARAPRQGQPVETLRGIRDHVGQMFETTRTAFVNSDSRGAEEVMGKGEETKRRVAAFLQDLAGRDDITPNEALVLGIGARLFSRTSSHLSNLASSVALPYDQIRRSDEN